MTDPIDPDTLTDPRDAAAYWFAREHSQQMSQAERRQFEAWRQAHPSHDLELRRARGIWNASAQLGQDRLRALTGEPQAAARRRTPGRRRLVAGLAVAGAAAVVAGVVLPRWGGDDPGYAAQYATRAGQRQQVSLPDASLVDLNTATQLSVALYADRRVVELKAGEATFSVTPDASRPFYVEAGGATIRVTGTRFNVRRDGDVVRVAVDSGTVAVQAGPWWNRSQVLLAAGQGTRMEQDGRLSPSEKLDVANLLAWQRGRAVFRDVPLSEAVSEMNRYGHAPIRVSGDDVAAMRISGVFSVDNPGAFLDLLPAIAPVRVQSGADGSALIVRR
ncbi:FecR domain-containing protein [Achromobacter pestifer]|uniref:FecR domain-containing protein n=1 Tax=Achromobacter pestifer TaxID=1353889 RepID=A0A7D4IHJ6_9BURK|nr:FecR domain-containing protein [Achromobacter pestifer]QKH36023.1 FecR domain-containing protein [Achromobacter pestifer]